MSRVEVEQMNFQYGAPPSFTVGRTPRLATPGSGRSSIPSTSTTKIPISGGRLCSMLHVGGWKSQLRAQACPRRTTRPLMLYGRPSSRAAPSRSPAASRSRTVVLDTRTPSTDTDVHPLHLEPVTRTRPAPANRNHPPSRAKPKVIAHQHPARRQPAHQDALDEFLGTDAREIVVESTHQHAVHAERARAAPASRAETSIATAPDRARRTRADAARRSSHKSADPRSRAARVTRSSIARCPRCTSVEVADGERDRTGRRGRAGGARRA